MPPVLSSATSLFRDHLQRGERFFRCLLDCLTQQFCCASSECLGCQGSVSWDGVLVL